MQSSTAGLFVFGRSCTGWFWRVFGYTYPNFTLEKALFRLRYKSLVNGLVD
jgi:hypothetical protein